MKLFAVAALLIIEESTDVLGGGLWCSSAFQVSGHFAKVSSFQFSYSIGSYFFFFFLEITAYN